MILWPEEPPSHSLTLAGTPSRPHPCRLPLPQGLVGQDFSGERRISPEAAPSGGGGTRSQRPRFVVHQL